MLPVWECCQWSVLPVANWELGVGNWQHFHIGNIHGGGRAKRLEGGRDEARQGDGTETAPPDSDAGGMTGRGEDRVESEGAEEGGEVAEGLALNCP